MISFLSKRIFSLLTFILFVGSLFCLSEDSLSASDVSTQEGDQKCFWVFFVDKGISDEDDLELALDRFASQMPSSTRLRRMKAQKSVAEVSDLPVFQPYIDGIVSLGATLRNTSRWLNGISVEIPEDSIPDISQLPYVKSVEPVVTYYNQRPLLLAPDRPSVDVPSQSRVSEIYGMSAAQIQQIHVDSLHEKGYHGEGIIIAILDTGFDFSHEVFRGINVLAQYDFVNNDVQTMDDPPADDIGQDDHGTEVLSIIAGNSEGNLVGPAYAASYLLAKTERISYQGVVFEERVEEDWWIAGLEWAERRGADIVSSSLGYSDWYSYSDMDGATAKTTIAAGIAIEKGMLIVVSAGNEGKSVDWPYISAPADGRDVIAVGAVNANGELADFSSIGPTYDGRIKPDLVAMGDGTYVVDPNSSDRYRRADGTSMATPLVAGTLAILMQALPNIDNPKDLTKLLKYTATRSLSPDNRYGWGIINAEAAFLHGSSPNLMEKVNEWEQDGVISDPRRVILYPNPVKRNSSGGRLSIYSSESMKSIKIYDITGLLVYERQNMDSARFSVWNLENEHGREVACGIYVCIIENSTGSVDIRKIAVVY